MLGEQDEIEAAYRRGYHQGADAAVEGAARLARSPNGVSRLREWVSGALRDWRHKDRLGDRSVKPPPIPETDRSRT